MLEIIIMDYSILGQHSRESALFSKKFATQLTLLGHAGSPCFLSFCYLRCRVLTCRILGRVILGDPGAVSRVGRKGGTKVFITGERAPGY